MKVAKFFSGLFALLGAVLLAAAVMLCFRSLDRPAQLLAQPDGALECSEELMEALCRGDYAAAGKRMYGQPNLGVDRDPADPVGVLLWDAFVDSIAYEFAGECYATDSGLARDVTVTALDFSSVTGALKERSRVLLEQRVAQAEDLTAIYDQQNNYQEDFVMEVLYDAACQALQEDAQLVRYELTLSLVCQQEQWWVMPEQALLKVISGAVAG